MAHTPEQLWAVASAVSVAHTRKIDDPSGGDHPVREVHDVASLKLYVESYLDGYSVTDASLAAAIAEGAALTESTLGELVSQSKASGLSTAEFFEANDVDLAAGVAAAASFGAEAEKTTTVRAALFAVWHANDAAGTCVFVEPGRNWSSRQVADAAVPDMVERGLDRSTPFFGWGGDRDHLEADGSFKRGEDSQDVFWSGDATIVRSTLQLAEQFGFAIEGGESGSRFRLVASHDRSSSEPNALPVRDELPRSVELGAVQYATSWVEKARAPKSAADVLDVTAARQHFESAVAKDLYVYPVGDAGTFPTWWIKIRPKKRVVVTHVHPASGSLARVLTFEWTRIGGDSAPDGQLIRRTVDDYLWPANHEKYLVKSKAERTISRTDIDSVRAVVTESAGNDSVVRKFRNATRRRDRLAYPVFGQWSELIDPYACEPEDPSAVEPLLIDRVWSQDVAEAWEAAVSRELRDRVAAQIEAESLPDYIDAFRSTLQPNSVTLEPGVGEWLVFVTDDDARRPASPDRFATESEALDQVLALLREQASPSPESIAST